MSDYIERIEAMLAQLPEDLRVMPLEPGIIEESYLENHGWVWLSLDDVDGDRTAGAEAEGEYFLDYRCQLTLNAIASYVTDVRHLLAEYKALKGRLFYMASEKEEIGWNYFRLRARGEELEIVVDRAFCNFTPMEIVEVMRYRGWDAEYDDQYGEIHAKLPWMEEEVYEDE
jgi:hypothetical protein